MLQVKNYYFQHYDLTLKNYNVIFINFYLCHKLYKKINTQKLHVYCLIFTIRPRHILLHFDHLCCYIPPGI